MDAPACTEPKLGGARGRSELTEQAENKKKKMQTEREPQCCKTKWYYVEREVMGVR